MWLLHFSCFFSHDKTASTSFLVRSSSFDFVVTKRFFLNRNVNSFSITLFSFAMCVSDFFVNIC